MLELHRFAPSLIQLPTAHCYCPDNPSDNEPTRYSNFLKMSMPRATTQMSTLLRVSPTYINNAQNSVDRINQSTIKYST